MTRIVMTLIGLLLTSTLVAAPSNGGQEDRPELLPLIKPRIVTSGHQFYASASGGGASHQFRHLEGSFKDGYGVYTTPQRIFFDQFTTFFWALAIGKQKFYDNYFTRTEVFHEQDVINRQFQRAGGGNAPVTQRLSTQRTGVGFGMFFPVWRSVSAGPVLDLYHQRNRVFLDSRNGLVVSDHFTRSSAGARGGFGANLPLSNLFSLSIFSKISSNHETHTGLIIFITPKILRNTED